jgi:2-dehydropantoate 2-reductase
VTEVDYINGWIVKRGEELGIRCSMNYMLMQLVKGKKLVVEREILEGVPIVGPKDGREDLTIREGTAQEGGTDVDGKL